MNEKIKSLLQQLPKIDEILLCLEDVNVFERAPRDYIVKVCRSVVSGMRERILAAAKAGEAALPVPSAARAAHEVTMIIEDLHAFKLRRVVNATGIILHTNLGRAPLCDDALARLVEVSRGYSNLEFDLESGKRGLRYEVVTDILCTISGAEDAMVVNNNAAAVLLVLNTMARGKEAIVSRGELIEIGGEFRIPDVMERSGARLREVGTTNRTHLADYQRAVNETTGLILKVHTSNFRIAGFTEDVALPDLVRLGHEEGIPVMNDLGSGCFIDLSPFGFEKEPTVQEALKTGVDVVTFSGDKLLGGPQAGIVLGRHAILDRIKKNPLNRALRIDKLTLAALEATMKLYLNPDEARTRIPGLRALTGSAAVIEKKAKKLLRMLKKAGMMHYSFSLSQGYAMAGGGSLPTQEIPTVLVAVTSSRMSVHTLGEKLRHLDVPVIARIADEEVLLDVRTVDEADFALIARGLAEIEGTDT